MAKKRRRKYSRGSGEEVRREMHRYKRGRAKSGRGGKGGKVKSRKQAIAIALSKARKKGKKVPRKSAESILGYERIILVIRSRVIGKARIAETSTYGENCPSLCHFRAWRVRAISSRRSVSGKQGGSFAPRETMTVAEENNVVESAPSRNKTR
jgi:Family of unknown function (DUF6496)